MCVEHVEKIVKKDADLLGEEPLRFPLYPPKIPHEMAGN